MDNNLAIWEPKRGRYYDTKGTNLNYVDLNEPFDLAQRAIWPGTSTPNDPVRHFRKVLLWTEYVDLLNYFKVENGSVKLAKTKTEGNYKQLTMEQFKKVFGHLLKTYASKSNVKAHMEDIARNASYQPLLQSEFYRKVYKAIRKEIKEDMRDQS